MHRHEKSMRIVFVLLTVLPIGWCGKSSAQNAAVETDTFAEILKTEAHGLPDEGIEEILRIRQQLGGGTGLEPGDLPGTLTGPPESASRAHLKNRRSPTGLAGPHPAITVSRIRNVARQLDALAADLEDLELFEHADDLRRKAAQLRGRVRGVRHSTGQPGMDAGARWPR